jgi:hypothetical protein
MAFSKSHFFLLLVFFISNIVLPFVDVVTDILTAIKMLSFRSKTGE